MDKFPRNKKESGVNRILGVGADTEAELLECFKDILENNVLDALKEKEKSIEQKELIDRINKEMSIFLKKYGVDSINIPHENIHIIDREKFTKEELEKIYKKFGTENGFYVSKKQSVIILQDYDESKLSFYQTVVHEMLHVQGFYSYHKSSKDKSDITLINQDKDEELGLNTRRSGFSIVTTDGKELFFRNLNESIITELQILFEKEFITKWPELQDELEEREKHVEYKKNKNGDSPEKEDLEIASVVIDGNHFIQKSYPYYNERKQFNLLVDGLYDKNKEHFKSREEVFELFVKAVMDGRILKVARLIEKTFGKGAFRMIGEKKFRQLS